MTNEGRVIFTEEMKETHTILIPMMLPIHFRLIKKLMTIEGYKVDILTSTSRNVIDTGLKYVHNDACYPALLTIGQLIDAAKSGQYDTHEIALLLMQTGGGCRASNYISLLRKALKRAHMEYIPVLSFNMVGLEDNPGFKIGPKLIDKLIYAVLYGDLIMNLRNQTQPYEVQTGDTERLVEDICKDLERQFDEDKACSKREMIDNTKKILYMFSQIKVGKKDKTKVGIVGEIYVKFSPLGNNNLEDFLSEEGCEVVLPGLMDFILYTIDAGIEDYKLYGTGRKAAIVSKFLFDKVLRRQNAIIDKYADYPCFHPPTKFLTTKELSQKVVNLGTKMGEGWLLSAEMVELIESGVNNIICTQPFGCLPNHIVGRGMIRKIKGIYPDANIVAIDFDASATKVNQENRIKLMLASSRDDLF